jgi:hypothetical protein
VAVALLAVALVATGAACGGDDEATGRESGEAAATDGGVYLPPRLEPSGRTGEAAKAAEVVLDAQEGFVTGSGDMVCFELAHMAEERLMGVGSDDVRACAEIVEQAIAGWRAAGSEPVLWQIGEVDVDGEEAAVDINDPDGGRHRVRVVKALRWELPGLDLDQPPGLRLVE